MRRLGRLRRAQHLERGAGRARRVVGLVAAGVERGDDRVVDEPVDLPAPGADRRDRALEGGVEHRRHRARVAAVREPREARQVGEDHAYVALARSRLVEVAGR
jgi:hypothetical protein